MSGNSSGGEKMLEILANDILNLESLSECHSPDNSTRFQVVSEDDCASFIKDNENKNTFYKTKSDMKIFDDWKLSIGENRDLEHIPAHELDLLLARFFLGIV